MEGSIFSGRSEEMDMSTEIRNIFTSSTDVSITSTATTSNSEITATPAKSTSIIRTRSAIKRSAENMDVEEPLPLPLPLTHISVILSNKQRAKAIETLVNRNNGTQTKNNKMNKGSAMKNLIEPISKKAKVIEKAKMVQQINEEIAQESAHAAPTKHEINNSNFLPNWKKEDNILDIPWNELGALCALGKTKLFYPRESVFSALKVWNKYLTECNEDPSNDLRRKKVFLLSIVLGFKEEIGSNRGDFKKKCIDLMADNWSQQTIGRFEGRIGKNNNKAKRKQKGGEVKTKEQVEEEVTSKRVCDLFFAGELGKACDALFNKRTYVQPTLKIALELQGQFPRREADLEIPAEQYNESMYELTTEETRKIIGSMHNNTHPGQDGLSINVVKQLMRAHHLRQGVVSDSDVFIEELTKFINNTIAKPTVTKEISAYVAGGEMIGIQKKDGSQRSITMAGVFKKIAQSGANYYSKTEAKELFKDNQMAVGTKNGTDKMIHTIRLSTEMKPEKDSIKTDCDKAFPRVQKAAALRVVQRDLPDIYMMTKTLLDNTSRFFYVGAKEGTQVIEVEEGIAAGESTSPLIFAAVKRELTNEGKKYIPNGIAIDYADDQAATGPTIELIEMAKFTEKEGPKLGIFPSLHKSECILGKKESYEEAMECQDLWHRECGIPKGKIHVHPDNDRSQAAKENYGFITLGIPLGADEYVVNYVKEKIGEIKENFKKIPKVNNQQVAYTILRAVMPTKINYLLRQLPTNMVQELVKEFDLEMRKCLAAICKVEDVSDTVFELAKLHNGGGLGNLEDTPECAYVASMIAALPFAMSKVEGLTQVIDDVMNIFETLTVDSLKEALDEEGDKVPKSLREFFIICKKLEMEEPTLSIKELLQKPEEQLQKLQHVLSKGRKENREKLYTDRLFAEGDNIAIAKYDSIKTAEAGEWLLGGGMGVATRMHGAEFEIALKLRLGMGLPGLEGGGFRCECHRKVPVEENGDHLRTCKSVHKEAISTHENVVRECSSMMRHGGIPVSTTFISPFQGLMNEESENEKNTKGDIMQWEAGKPGTMYDVRITSVLTANVMKGGYSEPGEAARASELEKNRKFQERCEGLGIKFVPLVIEDGGRWGECFIKFFNTTISAIADKNKIDISYVKNYWMKRISAAVQKGRANVINKRIFRLRAGIEAGRDESANMSVVEMNLHT